MLYTILLMLWYPGPEPSYTKLPGRTADKRKSQSESIFKNSSAAEFWILSKKPVHLKQTRSLQRTDNRHLTVLIQATCVLAGHHYFKIKSNPSFSLRQLIMSVLSFLSKRRKLTTFFFLQTYILPRTQAANISCIWLKWFIIALLNMPRQR